MDENSNQINLQEYLRNELQMLAQQIEILEANIGQLRSARDSLVGVKTIDKPSEILLPIANGIFLQTTVSNLKDSKLIINVGSSILVDKNIDDVLTIIETKLKELEENHQNAAQQYQATISLVESMS